MQKSSGMTGKIKSNDEGVNVALCAGCQKFDSSITSGDKKSKNFFCLLCTRLTHSLNSDDDEQANL